MDNHSSDHSDEAIEREFPHVFLIRNSSNYGFAKACNIGIKSSSGRYVMLFNPDAIAESSSVTELVRAIQNGDRLGAVSGVIYYLPDRDIIWSAGGLLDATTGVTMHVAHRESRIPENSELDYISGCAMLIDKRALDAVGLLDESFFLYDDDVDFGLRLKGAGFSLRVLPKVVAWHEGSMGKRRNSLRIYRYKCDSDYHLMFKVFPLRFLFSALFFRTLVVPFVEVMLFSRNPRYVSSTLVAFAHRLIHLKGVGRLRLNSNHRVLKNRLSQVVQTFLAQHKRKVYYW